jgi:hypothetical protein
MSFVNTVVPDNVVFAGVEPELSMARGVTVRFTVAVALWPALSVTVYVKLSGPE